MNFFISAHSQRGASREENQDSILALSWKNQDRERDSFIGEIKQTDLPGLLLLADGMGGHSNGSLASRIAIDSINETFQLGRDNFREGCAVQIAHSSLKAADNGVWRPMGTTVVGLVMTTAEFRFFNVGDSKCMHITEDRLEEVSVEDRYLHGRSKAITQCLGGGIRVPQVHIARRIPEIGDIFVLASDGLTDRLPPEQIVSIIETREGNYAYKLCEAALTRGSDDDISVIVLSIE